MGKVNSADVSEIILIELYSSSTPRYLAEATNPIDVRRFKLVPVIEIIFVDASRVLLEIVGIVVVVE